MPISKTPMEDDGDDLELDYTDMHYRCSMCICSFWWKASGVRYCSEHLPKRYTDRALMLLNMAQGARMIEEYHWEALGRQLRMGGRDVGG